MSKLDNLLDSIQFCISVVFRVIVIFFTIAFLINSLFLIIEIREVLQLILKEGYIISASTTN